MSFSRTFIYQAIDKVSPTLNKISKRMDGVSKKMSGIGRSMSMKVTAPIVAGFGTIIYQGAKFEDAMAGLEAITGIGGKALDKLGKQIMKTGEEFGLDAANIADGMTLIGSKQPQLLKTPKILLDVARSAAILSKASGAEFATSAGNMMDVLNAFQIQGKRANEVINVMAASVKVGHVEIPFLTKAMIQSGNVSKSLGIHYADTAAALQVLGAGGLEASQTGRIFANTLLRLERQTKSKFKPSIVGLEKALENLAKAGISPTKMAKMLGEENIKLFPTLISLRKEFIEIRSKIDGTNVAYEQAAIRMRTVNQRLARLWATIKNKLIVAFDLLKPTLIVIISKLVEVANVVGRFIKENPLATKWIMGIAAALAILGPAIVAVGVAISVLSIAITPVTLIVMGVIVALGLLAAGAYLLWKNWDVVWAGIKDVVKVVWDFIKKSNPLFLLADLIIQKWDPIKTFFTDFFTELINGFKSVENAARAFSLSGAVGGAAELLGFGGESDRALPTLGPKALAIQKQMEKQKAEMTVRFIPEGAVVTDVATQLPPNYLMGINNY